MKVFIAYPPLSTKKGYPTLGQNRQFQYFKDPTYIYPVVPAQAATLLKHSGYEVKWLDCIAQGIHYDKFMEIIKEEKPDLIAIETKTPVIKQHWKIIDEIKTVSSYYASQLSANRYPLTAIRYPLIALFGDHVSALPEESFKNSKVDYVLTGGDYDFLLLNLCNFLNNPQLSANRYPLTANSPFPDLEPGIYYRANGEIKNTGKFQLNHDLNTLPFIDRDLTRWRLYAYKNGNYKRTPGAYIMSGRDCWWGRCSFCSWGGFYPVFRSRSVQNVLEEIGYLISQYGVREIMDDTGTFPVGEWLREFCRGMISSGYNKKIYLDCNMRFGALSEDDYCLMKKAGFRLLLFGLESANQDTLDRINKKLKVQDIIDSCRLARKAGLFPHITIMFGYPWESLQDAMNTLKLGKWLLTKGYAYTMQATIVIPYPGTPLFKECQQNGWLKTLDWDDYDMKQPVMQSEIPEQKIREMVQDMYKVSFKPQFIIRKIFSLRDIEDITYYLRAARKVLGHIFDFSRNS